MRTPHMLIPDGYLEVEVLSESEAEKEEITVVSPGGDNVFRMNHSNQEIVC